MKGSDYAVMALVLMAALCAFANLAAIVAWGFAVLVLAALGGVICWKLGYLRHVRRYDLAERELGLRWNVFQNHGAFLVLDRKDGAAQFFARSGRQGPEPGPAFPGYDPPMAPLLPAVVPCDRLLVIGGMGAGKSELLKHLVAAHISDGHVMIADSHASPTTWPFPYAQVIGIGRDYAAIEGGVAYVCQELDRRYQAYSAGVRTHFPPLTLVVDELTVLHTFTDLKEEFKSLLCESRKVQIRLIFAGQSDRAGAIGLQGNNDLRAGFDLICYLEKDAAARRTGRLIDSSGKDVGRYLHPGPYAAHGHTPHAQHADTPPTHPQHAPFGDRAPVQPCAVLGHDPGAEAYIYEPPQPRPGAFDSRTDKLICDLYRAGNSFREIIRQALNKGPSGPRLNKVKNVLRRYGLM